ncbi:Regulatory protein SdiA [Leclercia adecarboxylata]|uniref:Regulatory protein SdiA n=1 Tax=Leclercia adecarboxylata TaxID=83655 RepID=A0A4V6JJ57_9ENTR|nr:Regulatory protein SdiA [Leclercia adecarboxylata]
MKFIPNYNDKHRIWDTISFHSAFVIRCLSPRPKVSVHSTYPQQWMAQYHAENYFVIDPVLKPENFVHGHLPWNDALFAEAQPLWDGARDHGLA